MNFSKYIKIQTEKLIKINFRKSIKIKIVRKIPFYLVYCYNQENLANIF